MKNHYIYIFALCFISSGLQLNAQTTIHRITGVRYNNYNADSAAYLLTDSTRWTYADSRGDTSPNNRLYDVQVQVKPEGDYLQAVGQFDANDNMIQTDISERVLNSWSLNGKYLYTYDASHRLTSMTMQQRFNNIWINIGKYEMQYNAAGDTIGILGYYPDSLNNLQLNSKSEMAYDNQHHILSHLEYQLAGGQITDTGYAAYFTYDVAGNLTLKRAQYNDNANELQDEKKWEYAYDTANRVWDEQAFDFDNNQWVPDYRLIHYYNSIGKLQRTRTFTDDGLGGLELYYEYEYVYDVNERLDTSWWREYDANQGNFVDIARNIHRFDVAGRKTLNKREDFRSDNLWHPTHRYEWEYDSHGFVTRETFATENDTAIFPNTESLYYYESHTLTAITEIENGNFTVFPNPVSGQLNILIPAATYRSFKLLNIAGQVVLAADINEATSRITADVSSLPNGMYLVQLQGASRSSTQKVLIQ